MDKDLRQMGEELVRGRILGNRKGSDSPQYLHSVRVAETLERFGYSEDVIIAGLLHDIIEDSETTFEELKELGYSDRIIEMVDLCTHKDEILNGDARWIEMIARLIVAHDKEAWAVKTSDVLDNATSSDTLPKERRRFMRQIKAPILLAVSQDVVGDTPLWGTLNEKVEALLKEEFGRL